jgi:hypothetical protein
MTVNTVSPAIISRAEFNRNAGQTKTPQLVRMDFTNLVTNGGFDTDTDWTKGTGWTIAAGVASKAAGTASNLSQETNAVEVKVGLKYLVSFDMTRTAGDLDCFLGGATVALNQTADQTVSTSVYPQGQSLAFVATSAYAGTVDNVSIYEADPSDDAPWLRLPYGYSVGRTGMIVRDGVILHPSDYTEIKDSGQTWIKPIVAPGVSTEFSIWGSTA